MIFNDTILQSLGIPTDGIEYHGEFPPYNPRLNELARELRNYGTKSEAMLWKVLKNKQTGYRFTRQKPILNFIAAAAISAKKTTWTMLSATGR